MTDDRDAGVDPRFDPVFQRGYDPTVHGESGAILADSLSAAPPEAAPPEAEPPKGERVDGEVRGRNPFQLALLLVSIASAAGAFLLIWRRFQDDPYGRTPFSRSPTDHFIYQLVESLMAPLLTGAIVGFCLWLVMLAIRPGSKRGE